MPRRLHVRGADNDLPVTYVCFILDESGSMLKRLAQVLSGFREYLETLKAEAGHIHFGLTMFNTTCRVAHAGVPVAQVESLTGATYRPNGNTALYDAIAEAVEAQDALLATAPEPWRVLAVVMTDGEENSSRRHTKTQIAALIQEKEATGRWSFSYLGADQGAWAEAAAMGIPAGSTSTYDPSQTVRAFRAMGQATVSYASSPTMATVNLYEGQRDLTPDTPEADTPSAEAKRWTGRPRRRAR